MTTDTKYEFASQKRFRKMLPLLMHSTKYHVRSVKKDLGEYCESCRKYLHRTEIMFSEVCPDLYEIHIPGENWKHVQLCKQCFEIFSTMVWSKLSRWFNNGIGG